MTPVTVRIGGHERPIAPFSAAKAIEAGLLVTQIVEHGNGIVARMNEESIRLAEQGTIRVPRAAAFYRDPERAAAVPAEAWEASGNMLEVPGPPPGFEQLLLTVFPDVFRVARDQVLKLLALVLVDERELQAADEQGGEGGVAELLRVQGRELLYRAQLEELLSVGAAAWEVCQAQLRSDPTALSLVTRLLGMLPARSSAGSNSAPDSSTASPTDTAGPAQKSSTGSRSKSSKRSTGSS